MELGTAAYARVIAGELNGMKGPAGTFTPVNVFDVRLEARGRSELRLPAGQNAAIVLLRGRCGRERIDGVKRRSKNCAA